MLWETPGFSQGNSHASKVLLELPLTDEGAHFRDMGERLIAAKALGSLEESERILQNLEAWIANRRKVQAAYGDPLFQRRRVIFDWPVYGSLACREADTPEGYFDLCAGLIRKLGAKVIHAGLRRTTPPKSVAG